MAVIVIAQAAMLKPETPPGERGTIALAERMAATKLLMDGNPSNLVAGALTFALFSGEGSSGRAFRVERVWFTLCYKPFWSSEFGLWGVGTGSVVGCKGGVGLAVCCKLNLAAQRRNLSVVLSLQSPWQYQRLVRRVISCCACTLTPMATIIGSGII